MLSAKDKRTGLYGCCSTFLVARFIYITDAFNKPECQVFFTPNPVAMLRPRKYITTYVSCLVHILTTILCSLSGLITCETRRRAVIARRIQSIQSNSGQLQKFPRLKTTDIFLWTAFVKHHTFWEVVPKLCSAPQEPSLTTDFNFQNSWARNIPSLREICRCNILSWQYQTALMKTPIPDMCFPHRQATVNKRGMCYALIFPLQRTGIWRIGDEESIVRNR
jgi:hypothetical protein